MGVLGLLCLVEGRKNNPSLEAAKVRVLLAKPGVLSLEVGAGWRPQALRRLCLGTRQGPSFGVCVPSYKGRTNPAARGCTGTSVGPSPVKGRA